MHARRLPPLVALALLLAGCGGSSSPSSASAATAPAGTSPGTPSAGAGAHAAGAAPMRVTTSPAAGSVATSGATAPGAAPAAAPGGTATTARTSTQPGTYTYDDSGTITAGTPHDASGTSTLTVDPPAAGRQHSSLDDGQGKTDQDLVVQAGGTYLARLLISNPAFTKEFRPARPVLLLPDPASIGRAWSWTATSTDGKTTASVSARIARRETLRIGGQQVVTTVVTSTLRLSGDVTYDAQLQTWVDTADRLTVKDHTKGSGTVSGLQFTSDVTRVMRSTRPS